MIATRFRILNLGKVDEKKAVKIAENYEKVINKAKKQGFNVVKYQVGIVEFWICCECGSRFGSRGDFVWHLTSPECMNL